MNFLELVKARHSVRHYLKRPVEREKIELLVESVRLAPSASNSQPWTLIIVDDPVLKEQVARATFSKALSFNRFTLEAPVIAVLVVEKPKVITQIGGWLKGREFPLIDIGIAAEQFCLQAVELELGTCMLGWFDEGKVKKLLSIPRGKRVGLLITLGYPDPDHPVHPKKRKEADAMSAFNRYPEQGPDPR
jgi:nitroreductase